MTPPVLRLQSDLQGDARAAEQATKRDALAFCVLAQAHLDDLRDAVSRLDRTGAALYADHARDALALARAAVLGLPSSDR